MCVQQANAARTITECHQLFPHDFQKTWCIRELHGHANRMPKTTHVFAQGRAWPRLRQLGVMARLAAGVVAPKRNQLLFRGCVCWIGFVSCVHGSACEVFG